MQTIQLFSMKKSIEKLYLDNYALEGLITYWIPVNFLNLQKETELLF